MKNADFVYLDNAATTTVNNDVLALHNRLENEVFANPNSIYKLGVISNDYLNKARELILKSFNLDSHKVVFTSSSTEANNLAIKGYCLHYKNRGKHIITTNIEHPSVLEVFKQLEEEFGFEVTILNVNRKGLVRLDDLRHAMRNSTILVSIMAINNEIGTVNPIAEIASIVHSYPKAVLHVDTTQAVGKINLNYKDIDMFVVSGHKIHGLRGSGALIFRKNISFLPLLSGGGQEYTFRSGTQSVPLACSLAKAIQLSQKDINKRITYVASLNSYLRSELNKLDSVTFNSNEYSSPYIMNFSLLNKKASVVVEALSNNNVFVSSVSACHSKNEAMSYVVSALGKDDKLAMNTIRISFDENNTIEEVDNFIKIFKNILETIK